MGCHHQCHQSPRGRLSLEAERGGQRRLACGHWWVTLQWGPFCDIPPPWPLLVSGLTVKVEDPKYKKDKQLNEKLSLFRGDITKLEVDAIVNAGEWGSWPP